MTDPDTVEYTQRWLPGVPVEYLSLNSNGPKETRDRRNVFLRVFACCEH
jgi:hypothetical protein